VSADSADKHCLPPGSTRQLGARFLELGDQARALVALGDLERRLHQVVGWYVTTFMP
jgi:hypothetical protein